MKQWIITQENKLTHKEKVFKIFYNEDEAVKYFDDLSYKRKPSHFKKYSYELQDCYGEILNCTL